MKLILLLFSLVFAITSFSLNKRKTRVTIVGNQFFINGEIKGLGCEQKHR